MDKELRDRLELLEVTMDHEKAHLMKDGFLVTTYQIEHRRIEEGAPWILRDTGFFLTLSEAVAAKKSLEQRHLSLLKGEKPYYEYRLIRVDRFPIDEQGKYQEENDQ